MNFGMLGLFIGEVVGLKVFGSFGSLGIVVVVVVGVCYVFLVFFSRGGMSVVVGLYIILNVGFVIF